MTSTMHRVARAKTQTSRAARGLVPVYRLDHNRWRKLKRQFKIQCARQNLACHICRDPIDYTLGRGRWAFEADHYHPRVTHPHLMFTMSNLRPSHVTCNRSRQSKVVGGQGDWVKPSW